MAAVASASRDKAADALARLKAVTDARAVSQDDVRSRQSDTAVAEAQLTSARSQAAAAEAKVQQTEMLVARLTVTMSIRVAVQIPCWVTPSFSATTAIASECWDGQFRRTFYTDNVNFAPAEGTVASCAFGTADLPPAN